MKIGTSTVTAIYLGTTSIVSAYLGATQVFGGASVFTPLSLFSTGAQGIWLDPSDLSTMFSDRAGTTPVTAPGTVVGLRLDKSKGLALGAELVVNGDFSTDTSWTKSGGVTISGGTANFAGVSDGTGIYQTASFTAGRFYRVTYTATISVGSISCWVGGFGAARNTSGTYSETIIAGSTNAWVGVFSRTSGTNATIDNISVRELPGNHAVAPTDAARPTYGVEPKGGRRNLLIWSEGFDNAAWTKGNTAITANADGVADLLYPLTSGTARNISRDLGGVSSAAYTSSIEAKASGLNFLFLYGAQGNSFAYFNLSTGAVGTVGGGLTAAISPDLGGGYYRCSVTQTATFNGFYAGGCDANGSTQATASGTNGVLIRNAQLELGSTVTPYQRVTTAYDVTESGVDTCHYVQYDGSDDSMSTAAIDFTGTDKMSVFAGVRKQADTTGVLAELSVSTATNNGTWSVSLPGSGSGINVFASKGTILTNAIAAEPLAPANFLVTGLGDISGDRGTIRINGAQIAQATGNQGDGNYGNYPLYIGRRNNATFPFNGKDYGIIVVGKAASAGEITDTETWLSAKTSGVTI